MADQIKTVSSMMKALQEEIEAVKAGTLSESAARIVFKGRGLQLKTAELNLQFQRMHKNKVGDMPMMLQETAEGNGSGT